MKKFDSDAKLFEVVNESDIVNWNSDVIFNCGTGSGKTQFVLKVLLPYCIKNGKSILFLSSRNALTNELNDILEDDELSNRFITITSYQSIEKAIKEGYETNEMKSEYSYLVLDECHHFYEGISEYANNSYEWVMSNSARRIFMSATAKPLFRKLVEDDIVNMENVYYIPKNYDYVSEWNFYSKKKDAESIIDNILTTTDEKIIYFINNLEDAYKLYKKYEGDCILYTSQYTGDKKIDKILSNQPLKIEDNKFQCRLLLATTSLDVGITLLDKSIKNIILNIFSPTQIIQSIGRKRIVDSEDSCKVYIRDFSRHELNIFNKYKYLFEMDMFKNDFDSWVRKYGSDRKHVNKYIYYNFNATKYELNELGYRLTSEQVNELNVMKSDGYKNYIVELLKLDINKLVDYNVVKEEKQVDNLIEYLNSIVGNRLFKEEQKELIEHFGIRDSRGRLQKSISVLNSYLDSNNFEYVIISKQVKITEEGKSKKYTVWQLSEGKIK